MTCDVHLWGGPLACVNPQPTPHTHTYYAATADEHDNYDAEKDYR